MAFGKRGQLDWIILSVAFEKRGQLDRIIISVAFGKRRQLDQIILSVAFGNIHDKQSINAPFSLVMLCVDRQMAKQHKNH